MDLSRRKHDRASPDPSDDVSRAHKETNNSDVATSTGGLTRSLRDLDDYGVDVPFFDAIYVFPKQRIIDIDSPFEGTAGYLK